MIHNDDALSALVNDVRHKSNKKKRARDNPRGVIDQEEKREEARQKEQHPEAIGFDIPFRALLLGGTGAGKTFSFVNKMLSDPACLRGIFRRIICFSPTMSMDPVWKRIYTEGKHFVMYHTYDDEIMRKIYDEQYQIFQECREMAEPILIFIDDNSFDTRAKDNHKWLDRTYVSGRHIDISVMQLCQKMHMMSPVQREQLSNMIMFSTTSKKSAEASHEQMGAFLDKDTFTQFFEQITAEPFKFMHCRKSKMGGVMQIWDGLDKCLVDNVNKFSAQIRSREPRGTHPIISTSSYQNQQGPQNSVGTSLHATSQTDP